MKIGLFPDWLLFFQPGSNLFLQNKSKTLQLLVPNLNKSMSQTSTNNFKVISSVNFLEIYIY